MLTGKKLGAAIEAARVAKHVTKKAMAEHFGVRPPSVQDWVNRGTIDKEKLPALWAYFADVVGPRHWGLERYPIALTAGVATEPDAISPTLADALSVVLEALGGLTPGRWHMVRARLDSLPEHPELCDDVAQDVLPLLAGQGANRTGTHG